MCKQIASLVVLVVGSFLVVAPAAHAQSEGNLVITSYATKKSFYVDWMVYDMQDGTQWLLDLTNFRHGYISFKDAAGNVFRDPNRRRDPNTGTNEATWTCNESKDVIFTDEAFMLGTFVPDRIMLSNGRTRIDNPKGYYIYKLTPEGGPGVYYYKITNETW